MAMDLTCDNRLEVHPFVSERKVLRMGEMVKGINYGGFASERAATDLKEALTATDAPFSLAHLLNIRNLPDYDKAPRQWTQIADTMQVDNFEPQTFYTLRMNVGEQLKYGKGVKAAPYPIAPVVPELDTYQESFGYSEESVKISLAKRGFTTSLSLERIISNIRPIVRQLPGDMLEVALDTEEFLVFDALQTQVTSRAQIQAGTAPITGATVGANPVFSIDALRLLLHQIGQRKITDANSSYQRQVVLADSYYIVTTLGNGENIEAALAYAKQFQQVRQGGTSSSSDQQFIYGAPPVGNLGRIKGVIESPYITSQTAWYLVPAAGTSRRPSLVKLQLTGRTAPEVLVNNFTGTIYPDGNGSDPFSLASFESDRVTLKMRMFSNSGLISDEQFGYSLGTGS